MCAGGSIEGLRALDHGVLAIDLNGPGSPMVKVANPCIDVCKYKREGHCIGCSMTKPQKAMFKTLKKGAHRAAFVQMLVAQQAQMGRYTHWTKAYRKKLAKKKIKDEKLFALLL